MRDRIAALYGQGIPAAKIFEAIRGENHCCQSTGKPATVKSVWKIVKDIDRATPGKCVPESVRRFVREACLVDPSRKTLTSELRGAFFAFCAEHGLPTISRNKLPAFIRAAVPTVRTQLASHHADGFELVGLALRT